MRGSDKNLVINKYIYKVAAGEAEGKAVILQNDGVIGKYNRANLRTEGLIKTSLPILVTLPLGFKTFPVPSAICLILHSIAEIMVQIALTH